MRPDRSTERRNVCCRRCKRPFQFIFQRTTSHFKRQLKYESSEEFPYEKEILVKREYDCIGDVDERRGDRKRRKVKISYRESNEDIQRGSAKEIESKEITPLDGRKAFLDVMSKRVPLTERTKSGLCDQVKKERYDVCHEQTGGGMVSDGGDVVSDEPLKDLGYWCLSKCMVGVTCMVFRPRSPSKK